MTHLPRSTSFLRVRLGLAVALALASLGPLSAAQAAPVKAQAAAINAEGRRLQALFDAQWEWQMHEYPEWATMMGDHRWDDRLTDNSAAAEDRRDAHAVEWLGKLKKVNRAALQGEDRVSLDYAIYQAQLQVAEQRFPILRTRVLSAMDGPHLGFPEMIKDTPLRNETDARHLLTRMAAFPASLARDIEWLRLGKTQNFVVFKASLSQVPGQIDGLLARKLEDNPLYDPFLHLPADLPADRAEALRKEAAALIQTRIAPAYVELRRVVAEEILPASPENGAMSSYPDGKAIYALAVKQQTTLDLSVQQIHDTGLAEVARIRAAMEAVIRSTGFKGSFAEFVVFANNEPKFFYDTPEALLSGYRDIAKRVDPELPRLFAELPRTPYGIRPIPEYQGAGASESYTGGAADGSTPGWFNANVVALKRRPKWEMEALFLHEGVPGHHLQIARALELKALPMFRRGGNVNAYAEGWALYAESLGDELGLYTDPYSRYGQLRMESWRAARLVVDTGIHALGWSREKAIDWMTERTGVARDDVVAEVDRYFVWPAQALGYKLGQLKISALRKKAREQLGDRFDLRRFHQAVLDHGALPLPVLEQQIDDWIASEMARK